VLSFPAATGPGVATEKESRGEGARRRSLWLALKVAVSAALVVWILAKADLQAIFAALSGVDAGWLALGLSCLLVASMLRAHRWGILLASQGVLPGRLFLFKSVLCSVFFRQFLPSTVGGDTIRGYDSWRAGASPGLAVSALVIDRLLGLIVLTIFALSAIAFGPAVPEAIRGAWQIILAGGAVLAGLTWYLLGAGGRLDRRFGRLAERIPRPVSARLGKVHGALTAFRGARGALWRAFGFSFLLQATSITYYALLAQALGLGIGYAAFYVIAPLAIVVMMLPLSINGIGLREGIFVLLLGIWGVGAAEAVALAWLDFGATLAYGVLGGIVYGLRRPIERPASRSAAISMPDAAPVAEVAGAATMPALRYKAPTPESSRAGEAQ